MVKKWIVICSIVVLLVAGCIWEHNFVNNTFNQMVESFTTYKTMLEQDKQNIATASNVEYLENLHSEFHEKEKLLKMLIWHTGLKDVEISISRILIYVRENDFTEALTETNALIDYCKHYSLDFSFTPENIF